MCNSLDGQVLNVFLRIGVRYVCDTDT